MNIIILGCNGNIGKYIADSLASVSNAKIIGIDLHSRFLGVNKSVSYYKNDFVKEGLPNKLKELISGKNQNNCFINLIAKDYPVTKSNNFLSDNSPFELDLDEVCNSFRVTCGSSYLLIKEIMSFPNSINHLILLGSIYSRKLPNPKNYSESNKVFKPVAYSLSKSAQNILFKEACRSLTSKKFRINMITLGGVYTGQDKFFVNKYIDKVPVKKMVDLNEIEDCLKWLIFESPIIINGSDFLIDGGWSLAN